jgi:hypothetical protein
MTDYIDQTVPIVVDLSTDYGQTPLGEVIRLVIIDAATGNDYTLIDNGASTWVTAYVTPGGGNLGIQITVGVSNPSAVGKLGTIWVEVANSSGNALLGPTYFPNMTFGSTASASGNYNMPATSTYSLVVKVGHST